VINQNVKRFWGVDVTHADGSWATSADNPVDNDTPDFGPCVRASDYDALNSLVCELAGHIRLAEEKVDQHLQGQYNWSPYPALGTALAELRAALNLLPKE
jgi:hypothetical protein